MDDMRGTREQSLRLLQLVGQQPDDQALDEQLRILHQCVQWLPKPEQSVIRMYYYQNLTLKQIAKEINRSESRAHQLHAQAIMRLSGFLTRQQGLFHDSSAGLPGPRRGRGAAARK